MVTADDRPAAGYELDPHSRSLAICAVVGGSFALLTFVVGLTMPAMSWAPPAAPAVGLYERISASVMAVWSSRHCCWSCTGRWAAVGGQVLTHR